MNRFKLSPPCPSLNWRGGERSECKGRLEYNICVYRSISTYVDGVRVCRLLLIAQAGHI